MFPSRKNTDVYIFLFVSLHLSHHCLSAYLSIPLFASPCCLCLHHIVSISEWDRRCGEVRRWLRPRPGWWVWVVIGWCSLLIWYGVWLRSLIRDSSSQRETGLSITTRTPLARAKWDWDKGREKSCRNKEGMKMKKKKEEVKITLLLASDQHGAAKKGMRIETNKTSGMGFLR